MEKIKKDDTNVFILRSSYGKIINYSYILTDFSFGQAVIIDPAWNMDAVRKALNNLRVSLCGVLLTHSHFDHTNLVGSLVQEYNVNVYIGEMEKEFYKFNCRNLKPLQDKDVVYVGETVVTCILTPGHTAGSVCYYTAGSMFTGDTVFVEGCGMCTPGGAPGDLFESIQKIKKIIPPDTLIYPGHCYGSKVGCDLRYLFNNNIYFQINQMDEFIAFRMRKEQRGLFDFK